MMDIKCTTRRCALKSLCESIRPSVRYQLVKMLINLVFIEPHGILDQILQALQAIGQYNSWPTWYFAYLFF